VPTYQYVCESCATEFEKVQSFSEPSLRHHDEGCGGPVRKRYGNIGVVFKGTGFYRNDSRGADKGEKAESGKADTKSESTSDTKGDGGAKTDGAGAGKGDSTSKGGDASGSTTSAAGTKGGAGKTDGSGSGASTTGGAKASPKPAASTPSSSGGA